MASKRDIKQIEAIAREFGMDDVERCEFGDFVEDRKRNAEHGTATDGDFTYAELRELAREFRGDSA